MFDVIRVTHKNMMTIPGTHMGPWGSTHHPGRHHTQIDLLTCRVCFVKHMMITTQVRHHNHVDLSTCRVCSVQHKMIIKYDDDLSTIAPNPVRESRCCTRFLFLSMLFYYLLHTYVV